MEKNGNRKKWRKPVILAIVLIIIGGGGGWVYTLLPTGLPDGEDYFKPIGERQLLEDEKGQWEYAYHQYSKLEVTGDEFKGWDKDLQNHWRYAIAFAAYGMPSLCLVAPEEAGPAKHMMAIMIDKMKSKKVWRDFVDYGMGPDPISYQNIMYKAHLNLMYGLYQLISGDERYAKEYTWLTRQILAEMRKHHKEGRYEGANCEPDRYFAQCNSISLLSLHIYDKLYGTRYTENEVQWTLDFVRQKMTDPETGLFYYVYHPTRDSVDPYLSGYTNAWTLAALKIFDPEYYAELYDVWKKTFVKEIGPYAMVREVPDGGPSQRAHMFGLWASKEFKDVALFTKLRNAIDKQAELYRDGETTEYKYRKANNQLYNAGLLWIKLHVGFDTIINHDWGIKTPMTIPDTTGMTWKDVLHQEIRVLNQDS